MKKLNNKGFALSTVLYGLLIMGILIITLLMSVMSNNRKNTSTLVQRIEEELNRYTQTQAEFSASDESQEYIVPYGKAGWYKVELWGASGGSVGSKKGGLGAYTSGIIYLEENDHLYIYTGKTTSNTAGGYNGGGKAIGNSKGGGGATDIRLESGAWNDTSSLKTRIMVAAGGGGATSTTSGGDGGTLIGEGSTSAISTATQSTDNLATSTTPTTTSGGSGGGYYASNNHVKDRGGDGGSSYIAGFAGVQSFQNGSKTTNTDFKYQDKSRYFINGMMIPGVNEGDGRAKIEQISSSDINNPPTKRNNKLNNVRYIYDCINGNYNNNTKEEQNYWLEIQAIQNGVNVAKEKNVITTDSSFKNQNYITDGIIDKASQYASGTTCVTIDLGALYNLDELAVWHNYTSSRNYINHTLAVSSDNSNWSYLKSTSSQTTATGSQSETETANGVRYSAWQPDTTTNLPNGNYYIFSTVKNNDNRCLTAKDAKEAEEAGKKANVSAELFEASALQKWYIENIKEDYYKVIETKNNYALQTSDGTAEEEENVNVATTYGNHEWEIWKITPLGNGNYIIETQIKNYVEAEGIVRGAYLNINKDSYYNVNLSYIDKDFSQRFKLINAEY